MPLLSILLHSRIHLSGRMPQSEEILPPQIVLVVWISLLQERVAESSVVWRALRLERGETRRISGEINDESVDGLLRCFGRRSEIERRDGSGGERSCCSCRWMRMMTIRCWLLLRLKRARDASCE